jgi:universal stress protein A
MKIEHILIPMDFSDSGQLALDYAAALRGKFPAQITLLHVIEPFLGYGSELSIIPADVEVEQEQKVETRLKELAAAFTGGAPANAVCRRGKPWNVICEWAAENKVDLIVMPTHGYSGLLHMWLGSVAERVVRKAPCPVLVIPAKS